MKPRIAIIGGGFLGLSLAYYLNKQGFSDITIIEKDKDLGGLGKSFYINDQPLEIFYHHFFKNDQNLISLIKEVGLEKDIEWIPLYMGLYLNNQLLSFSTAFDILKLPVLGIFERFRLGLISFYLQRKSSAKDLEDIPALSWCKKYFGNSITEKMWQPLLISKFGKHYKTISMAWLWARLYNRASSRTSPLKDELLGYIKGSYKTLTDRLESLLKKQNCTFILDAKVLTHKFNKGQNNPTHTLQYRQNNQLYNKDFDIVISTMPPNTFEIYFSLPSVYAEKLRQIKSLGVTCLILELNQSFSKYYWSTVNDPESPFLAFVEHTKLVPAKLFKDTHILYLPKYLDPKDKQYSMPKDEILELYVPYLKKINPKFSKSWIRKSHLYKADYAQHIANINYPMLPYRTGIKGLYYANFCQVFPHDRGVSRAVEQARELANVIENDYGK